MEVKEVKCDRCGGNTKPKQITSKKNNKQYTVYECLSGCKSGAYAYSCFPPKESKESNQGSGEGTKLLQSIDATLKRIETILANPKERHVSADELKPDPDVPF